MNQISRILADTAAEVAALPSSPERNAALYFLNNAQTAARDVPAARMAGAFRELAEKQTAALPIVEIPEDAPVIMGDFDGSAHVQAWVTVTNPFLR
jgi:hypothetical protein